MHRAEILSNLLLRQWMTEGTKAHYSSLLSNVEQETMSNLNAHINSTRKSYVTHLNREKKQATQTSKQTSHMQLKMHTNLCLRWAHVCAQYTRPSKCQFYVNVLTITIRKNQQIWEYRTAHMRIETRECGHEAEKKRNAPVGFRPTKKHSNWLGIDTKRQGKAFTPRVWEARWGQQSRKESDHPQRLTQWLYESRIKLNVTKKQALTRTLTGKLLVISQVLIE